MKKSLQIKRIIGLGVLGALVACLSLIKIQFGAFSITLALVPLVVGAILYGPRGGIFLGFIMGLIVLFIDSAAFYVVNPFGTIIVVLFKSIMAGFMAGLIFTLLKNKNQTLGIILATISAPIINTLIFILGCLVFFLPTLREWAGGENVFTYIIVYLVGTNFLVEFIINAVLAPSVIYLIKTVAKNYDLGSNLE